MPNTSTTNLESQTEEKPSVKIRIATSRVLEYTAKDFLPDASSEGDPEVQFGFNVKSTLGITGELDRVILVISITCFVGNPENQICYLETEHVFEIQDFEQFRKEDQTVVLPPQVSATMVGVALGMARGIFFAKNFGTSYANVILPLMNMEDLLPKEPFRLDGPFEAIRVKAH